MLSTPPPSLLFQPSTSLTPVILPAPDGHRQDGMSLKTSGDIYLLVETWVIVDV